MEQLTTDILQGNAVRKSISDLRKKIKENPADKSLCLQENMLPRLEQLLSDEDAKTRKNTALLLGDLAKEVADSGKENEVKAALWEAFLQEETKFVKSAYVRALSGYDVGEYVENFKQILKDLNESEIEESDLKHVRELRRETELLLAVYEKVSTFSFQGIKRRHLLLLTAESYIQENLVQEINRKCKLEGKITPRGVRVETNTLDKIKEIPLYRDMLFFLRLKQGTVLDASHLAEGIVNSELLPLLMEVYGKKEKYPFRLSIYGKDAKDIDLSLKELSYQVEELSQNRLVNRGGQAVVTILIVPKKDGNFLLFGKFFSCPGKRFRYYTKSLPTAMAPVTAAQMISLISPYLTPDAHIIDLFCGQGTLLLERTRHIQARDVYGVDTYAKAIEIAREQTKACGKEFYYINRDFFDFTTTHLLDEILTEFPRMENKSKETVEMFYHKFFDKAIEITTDSAMFFLLSTEENRIKKELRLRDELQLVRQIAMRGAEHIFIIKRRG